MSRDWSDLPSATRVWVEGHAGSTVREFRPASRSTSGGVLGVASGGRSHVFVKAVPAGSGHENDYRTEVRVRRALPRSVPVPRLRGAGEHGGWYVIVSDVAPGRIADEPWPEDELGAVLELTARLAPDLTPAPVSGLLTVADRMWGRCTTWRRLLADGECDGLSRSSLSRWELDQLSRLAVLEAQWPHLVTGRTLLHVDLRHDNVMIAPDGAVALLGWGRACVGPGWVDRMCLLLQSDIGTAAAQPLFVADEVGAGADPAAVDGFLVALASYWRHAASLPADAGDSELRERQARSGAATLRWLQERWS